MKTKKGLAPLFLLYTFSRLSVLTNLGPAPTASESSGD